MSDTTSSSLEVDYITLLTTQLQNQNPLDPMDSTDMTAQLTSISQLAQLETLNTTFSEVLEVTEQSYASSLLGTDVTFVTEDDDGESTTVTGTIDQVLSSDDEFYFGVGDYSLTLDDIVSFSASTTDETTDTDE